MHVGRALENPFSERGCRLDDVFAIIEHDEHRFGSEIGENARQGVIRVRRDAEFGRERARNEPAIYDWPEIDEADAVLVGADEVSSDRQRKGRLTDAARTDDRDEA